MPFSNPSSVFRVDQDGVGGGEGDTQIRVQVLSDGSFVFAWRELEDNLADHYRIFVRKFGSNLTPIGNQVKIDGAMTDQGGNGFTTPSIAATADGSFVVEYDDFGGGTNYSNGSFYVDRVWSWVAGFDANAGLYAQVALLGAPPNIDDPVQNQSIQNGSIAPNGDNGYHSVVVQGFISNPNARYLLVNRQQVDIGLSPAGQFIQMYADIADAGDSAFVVWNRGVSATDSDIFGMFVGQPLFKINTQTAGLQTLSQLADSIAVTSDGSFVVVWSDLSTADDATDPGTGVRARVIGADGIPLSGEIILPLDPAGNESRPMVAPLDNGYWIAVWEDERGHVGQLFDPLGVRYGDEQVLIAGYAGISAMTILPGNKLLMSWQLRPADAADTTVAQTWQLAFSNFAPFPGGDEYYGLSSTPLTVDAAKGLLANDQDLDGDTLTATVASGPQHGIVTINPDGSFEYRPDFGWYGSDYFTYTINDGTGNVSPVPGFVRIEIREERSPSGGVTLITEINKFLYFLGIPADFDQSVFTGFWGEVMLGLIGELFIAWKFSQTFGSLVLNIDTNGDGVPDSVIEFEDPVPNVTIRLDPAGDRVNVSFDELAAATAGNDTISGTAGMDYIGGDDGNDTLRGLGGNDALAGGNGNDTLLPGEGTDSISAGAGSDGIYFGKEMDATDKAEGGDGVDSLAIQGNYANLVLAGMTGIEVLFPAPGNDTRFGDIGGNSYDYVIKTVDANVAAGATLTVIGVNLRPGEDLTFDGSAETDGVFRVFAGQGLDNHKGGSGNDGFFFGADANLTGADRVDGAAGADSIALRGNYFGANAVVFQDASFTGIEVVALLSGHTNEFGGFINLNGFDYTLTMANGNVAAGQRLDVIGSNLRSNESLVLNGSAETDGFYRVLSGAGDDSLTGGTGNDTLYGGLGADTLAGGPGNDIYLYRGITESNAASRDTINGFATGDRIDLGFIDADSGTGANDAFAFIGTGAFTGVAGQLRASQSGADTLIEADVNGDSVADLAILLAAYTATNVVAADFVL